MTEHEDSAASQPYDDREQLFANAVAAYVDLQLQGKGVDRDRYCQAHPEFAPDLRMQILALDEIDTAFRSEGGVGPGYSLQDDELPERLSGLKVLGEIGRGGMGRVLVALDERLGRQVAVKTLNPRFADNPKLRARFMHEARALARLSHQNIVRIYNLGGADEEPHFVMEYIEGASLTDVARRLALDQKIDLMLKVILTVDFLHQHQVIHRDLKPGNILVSRDLEPKVLDFGLALQGDEMGARLTQVGEIIGTPDYFSPEQAKGDMPLDVRSDIFSLGTILYELITGATPFRGDNAQSQIRLICECDPLLPRRINPAVPGELQNICLKALEKNPSHRYQSAREMAVSSLLVSRTP